MPDRIDQMIRQEMEGRQTWQKVAGWVLIVLGGSVLAGVTIVMLATVFNWVEFTPISTSARVFIGLLVLLPLLAFDYWLIRQFVNYRQSREWLAKYKRSNPLPYRMDEE